MSDAKAAAAARRAKILSRDKSRLDIAKGLKDALEEKPDEVAAEIKERPLAYRRRLVKKIKEDDNADADADADDDDKEDIKETKTESDNKDETISLLTTDDNSKEIKTDDKDSAKDATTTTDSDVKISSIRNRRRKLNKDTESDSSSGGGMISEITKRVEREIAEATKNHETKIRNEDETKSEKNMAIKRRRAQIKANLLQPLQSYQILKMARVLVIILLGCFTGYKFASTGTQTITAASKKFRENAGISATSIVGDLKTSRSADDVYKSLNTFLSSRFHNDKSIEWSSLMKRLNLQSQDNGQYDNDFDESAILSVIKEDSNVSNGTWIGWFKSKFYKQLDSTFCALGIVWWLAKVLAYFLEKIAKDNKSAATAEKTNILQKVFTFLTEGFGALIEKVYESLGEMALYTIAVIVSSSFIIIFQNEMQSIIMMGQSTKSILSVEDEL